MVLTLNLENRNFINPQSKVNICNIICNNIIKLRDCCRMNLAIDTRVPSSDRYRRTDIVISTDFQAATSNGAMTPAARPQERRRRTTLHTATATRVAAGPGQ